MAQFAGLRDSSYDNYAAPKVTTPASAPAPDTTDPQAIQQEASDGSQLSRLESKQTTPNQYEFTDKFVDNVYATYAPLAAVSFAVGHQHDPMSSEHAVSHGVYQPIDSGSGGHLSKNASNLDGPTGHQNPPQMGAQMGGGGSIDSLMEKFKTSLVSIDPTLW